jgi:hypothetical protein
MPRFLSTAIAIAIAAASAVPMAQGPRREIYATVVDDDHMPIRGLNQEDFQIRDGGVRRPIQHAVPAPASMAVAIVTGGFAAGDRAVVRKSIQAIVGRLRADDPAHQVGAAGPDGTLQWFPPGTEITDTWLDRWLAGTTSPTADAIASACAAIDQLSTDRRVVVALIQRGAADPSGLSFDALSRELTSVHATLWTVEVRASAPSSDAKRFDDALADAVRVSGSLREPIAAASALPKAAEEVADRLLSQYLLTYTWPDSGMPSFATRHDRGTVLVPTWYRQ